MDTALLSLHIIICVFLVILVLLQAGREGMGVIFGGNNSSGSASSSSSMLTKLTASLAVIFICTSLGYNIVTSVSKEESSILDVQFEETAPTSSAPTTAPTTPTTPAAE